MIVFDGIKTASKNLSFLRFKNKSGKRISIPISKDIANLISSYLRLFSSASQRSIEPGNDEESN